MSNPPPVFISYARADDAGRAEALREELSRRRVGTFLDTQFLDAAEPNPPPPIVAALQASRIAVLLVTPAYAKSSYCAYEAGLAIDRHLRGSGALLPVTFGEQVRFPMLPALSPAPTGAPIAWLADRVAKLLDTPSPGEPILDLRPWWTLTPSLPSLAGVDVAPSGTQLERGAAVCAVAHRWAKLDWAPVWFRLSIQPGDTPDALASILRSFPRGPQPLLSLEEGSLSWSDVDALRVEFRCGVELLSPRPLFPRGPRALVDLIRVPVLEVVSPSRQGADAPARLTRRVWDGPTVLLDGVDSATTLARVRALLGVHPRVAVSGERSIIHAHGPFSVFHPLSGIAPWP